VISVIGSSYPGPQEPEYAEAYEIGKKIAASGFALCNGGYGGTMEGSARGAKEAGGHTIGVTMASLSSRTANPWIDEVVVEDSLINRLMRLIALGDGYVVLRGGTGTLLELAAVWEFMNKSLMRRKPCVALGEFWNGAIQIVQKELLREGSTGGPPLISTAHTADECLRLLKEGFLLKEE